MGTKRTRTFDLQRFLNSAGGARKVVMNKFRKLGFIEYDGGLKINSSLLSVVLHD